MPEEPLEIPSATIDPVIYDSPVEVAAEGGNNRYFRIEGADGLYSLPRRDSDETPEMRDFEDVLGYQLVCRNNLSTLQQEGIPTKNVILYNAEYEGRSYPLLGSEEIDSDFIGNNVGEKMFQTSRINPLANTDTFGDGRRQVRERMDTMLENEGGRSFEELREDGEIIYNGLLGPDDVYMSGTEMRVLDQGELTRLPHPVVPYSSQEELFEALNIEESIEHITEDWDVESFEYPSDDPLLDGF